MCGSVFFPLSSLFKDKCCHRMHNKCSRFSLSHRHGITRHTNAGSQHVMKSRKALKCIAEEKKNLVVMEKRVCASKSSMLIVGTHVEQWIIQHRPSFKTLHHGLVVIKLWRSTLHLAWQWRCFHALKRHHLFSAFSTMAPQGRHLFLRSPLYNFQQHQQSRTQRHCLFYLFLPHRTDEV